MSTPAARVHASAPAAAPADCGLAFTGYLASKPHVAMKACDHEGLFVPVLELHLQDVGPGHNSLTAHVPYHPNDRAKAEAAARQLQRGQRVTVTTHLADIRLLLPAAVLSTEAPEGGTSS